MKILERGEKGFGLLIEQDAGYISYDVTKHNKDLFDKILTEGFEPKPNQLIIVDCILQKWGIENRNGRIYPKEVLVPEVEKYMIQVREGSAISESDHPATSTVSLQNISHIIKDMWWGKGNDQNVLYGKLEIVTSPAYMREGHVSMIGDKIVEYLKRGVKLGISSRGIGSLEEKDGRNIVQPDFELICFDLVASPSTPGAFLFPKLDRMNNNHSSSMQEQITKHINEEIFTQALDRFLI